MDEGALIEDGAVGVVVINAAREAVSRVVRGTSAPSGFRRWRAGLSKRR
jgi:hypothetical protein